MTATILNPPFPVVTIHGEGYAMMHIDYGMMENGCFLVASKKDGQFRYYSVIDCKLAQNFTYEIGTGKQ